MKIHKKTEGIEQDFTQGNVAKQLLTFSSPLFLAGLLQIVYSMTDMMVVGKFIGSEALAAVSVGGEVLNLLTFVAMGLSNAGQILIAQHIGAGKRDQVGKIIGTLFTLLLVCAGVMTALCLGLRGEMLLWLHVQEEAMPDAVNYLMPCIGGLIFIYGYNLVSAILRGFGDARHPFLFVFLASGINIILDLVFIIGLKMGTAGAALATVIGQAFSFLAGLVFLYRNRKKLNWGNGRLRADKGIMKSLLKLGIPMALQSAAVTFSKLYITSWVNTYGIIATAVTGIGNKLITITNVFSQALATAGGTMIAQNIGAAKYRRVSKVIGVSMLMNAVAAALLTFITAVFPQELFGLFTKEPEVLAMAVDYVPVAIVMYASCIVRPPMNALINGSGNSSLNLMIALLDGIIVRIGLALILGVFLGMGIRGFWYGNAFAGFVPFLIGGVYYLTGKWKTDRYFRKKQEEK